MGDVGGCGIPGSLGSLPTQSQTQPAPGFYPSSSRAVFPPCLPSRNFEAKRGVFLGFPIMEFPIPVVQGQPCPAKSQLPTPVGFPGVGMWEFAASQECPKKTPGDDSQIPVPTEPHGMGGHPKSIRSFQTAGVGIVGIPVPAGDPGDSRVRTFESAHSHGAAGAELSLVPLQSARAGGAPLPGEPWNEDRDTK